MTVAGERSRWFGPEEEWRFSGNGAVVSNLDADFFYTQVNESGIVEDLMSRPPPQGPLPALRKVVRGYVAGYNHYLRKRGVERIPDPRCRGAAWVRPITELDVYRRFHSSAASRAREPPSRASPRPSRPLPSPARRPPRVARSGRSSTGIPVTGKSASPSAPAHEVAFSSETLGIAPSIGSVDVSEACSVLASWTLHNDLDAPGAVLFQRFAELALESLPALPTGVSSGNGLLSEALFDVPFSPADPVNTPRGLNTADPVVGRSLADAVADLRAAGIPLDATMDTHQYEERGGERIPIHGGPGSLGLFNAINSAWDPQAGYSDVPHGTSFIAAMGFSKRGCPARSRTFVTYGQSENPRSRHAADYNRAFSAKRWNKVPFCGKQVRHKTLETVRISRR